MEAMGGNLRVAEGRLDTDALRAMNLAPAAASFEDVVYEYASLSQTRGVPTAATRRLAHPPLDLFGFFPRALCVEIVVDTNRYGGRI